VLEKILFSKPENSNNPTQSPSLSFPNLDLPSFPKSTDNMHFSALPALFFAALAVAAPTQVLETRQSSTQCGNNYYSADQVQQALNQGENYYYNGQQVGRGNYPYVFSGNPQSR
jgi:hypothetical protein